MKTYDATTPPAVAVPAARVRGRGARRRPVPLFAYLCLLPAVAFAGVFLYYPTLSALYHAFTDWDGVNAANFVGLANFQQMFSDTQMRQSFLNGIEITVVTLILELIVPLTVAKMILALRNQRMQHLIRLLFVFPLIVPQVIIYLLWLFIYDPNVGLLNATLDLLHLGFLKHDWLGDPGTALYAVMATGAGIISFFPFVDGFGLLIYTAGLQAIPAEIIESAQLDGAGWWRRFWRVEFPLILGQLRLMSVLTITYSVQLAAVTAIVVLTGGGPGFATYIPGFSMYYNAFYYNHMGYACAIGTVLFLFVLVLTILNLRFVRPSLEFDAGGRS